MIETTAGRAGTAERSRSKPAAPALPKRRLADICLPWAIPLFAIEVAIGSLATSSANDIGGHGLISAVSPVAMFATLALTISFFVMLSRPRVEPSLLGFHLLGLACILTLAPFLIEHTTRFPTAYLHSGFADYIARHGDVLHSYDARFSWPGFFALVAMLSRLTGVEPLAFSALANIFLVLVELVLIYGIAKSLVGGVRRPWLACYFYLVANWVGQDYFGPQGLNLLFYLSIIFLVLRFLRPAPAVDGARPNWPIWRIWWKSLGDRETPPAELPPGGRFAVIGVVVLILGASVVSHQLTPIGLAGILYALVIVGRLKARALPVILTLMVSAWLSYEATDYWFGHLGLIFGGVGKVAASVSSNVGDRIVGAPSHLQIVRLRLLETIGVAGLAGVAIFRSIRHQGGITLAVLLGVPVMLVGVQDYGGEAALRVYLYALPGIAMLLSVLFLPTEIASRLKLRASLAAVVGIGLLVLFPFSRYGNESFESFPAGDVEMARYLLVDTPTGTPLVFVSSNTPASFANLEEHPVTTVTASSTDTAVPSLADIEKTMTEAETQGRPQPLLYLSKSQFAYLKAFANIPADTNQAIVDELQSSGRFVQVRSNETSSVWRMTTP